MTKCLFNICELYEKLSIDVANKNHLDYPLNEVKNVTQYILKMKNSGKI